MMIIIFLKPCNRQQQRSSDRNEQLGLVFVRCFFGAEKGQKQGRSDAPSGLSGLRLPSQGLAGEFVDGMALLGGTSGSLLYYRCGATGKGNWC